MMGRLLKKADYLTDDVVSFAQLLIGCHIYTRINNNLCEAKIVETEAYKAPEDKASHAYLNKRTARTEIMFHEGGVIYMYLCYGIHNMLNIVTGKEGVAHATLIRAIEPLDNISVMKKRRNATDNIYNIGSGPGKVAQALGLNTTHNASSLLDKSGSIWIEKAAHQIDKSDIEASPRVGIAYANEHALWHWRFRLKNSKYTSKPVTVRY